MTPIEAGNFVSLSQALVYTTPFIVAIILDSFIDNYLTLLTFSIGAYLPGLIIMIALTAYPYLLGATFPTKLLKAAMLVFSHWDQEQF
jgi:POT family proton-dependent oligopeptide transporter